MNDGHAFLEDDLVRQDVESSAQGDDVTLRVVTLAVESYDGGLPDLFVLVANTAQLGEHGPIQVFEVEAHFRRLLLLYSLQGVLHMPRLILDILEG